MITGDLRNHSGIVQHSLLVSRLITTYAWWNNKNIPGTLLCTIRNTTKMFTKLIQITSKSSTKPDTYVWCRVPQKIAESVELK